MLARFLASFESESENESESERVRERRAVLKGARGRLSLGYREFQNGSNYR